VVVFGREWFFGGGGIYDLEPGQTPYGTPVQTIEYAPPPNHSTGVRVARGTGVVANCFDPSRLTLQRGRTQYGHNVDPAGAVRRDAG
jgi:hypothetical protein